MDDPAVIFGFILKRLRKEAELTQEALAGLAEVERNFVSLIERGINQPSLRVIFRLAGALNTTPSQMLHLVEVEMLRSRKKRSSS